jgi:hypothetical protein
MPLKETSAANSQLSGEFKKLGLTRPDGHLVAVVGMVMV